MASNWQTLSPGLDYQDFNAGTISPWSHIHVFRIDLQSFNLSLSMAKDFGQTDGSAEEFRTKDQSLLSVNGGFFDNHHRPLGLRISDGEIKNSIKPISWWGIFYIKDHRAHIGRPESFMQKGQVSMAIQSGPRLLVNGKIPSLKPGRAERSALCIDKAGLVHLVVTDHTALTTTELAEFMKAPPVNCYQALNLDGGSSSQLNAEIGDFKLNVPGFANVSDAIVLKKR